MDTIRILRIVEYVGPREGVEDIVAGSIHGTRTISRPSGYVSIRASTIGAFPEILEHQPPRNTLSQTKTRLYIEEEIALAADYYPGDDSKRQGYLDALKTIQNAIKDLS